MTLVALFPASDAGAEGDPARGETVFAKCAVCHNADKSQNKVGPYLIGLWGRQPGTLEGYRYSLAMVEFGASGVVWNDESLMTYLEDPRGVVKGSKWPFRA